MEKKYIVAILILIIAAVIIWSFGNGSGISEQTHKEISENYCDKIQTPEMKKTCTAMLEKNYSVCNNLPYFNDLCYLNVLEISDISESLCESFSDYAPRTTCYMKLAKIKKDHSFCEKASGKYQECSGELAKLLKNPQLCDEIEVDCEKYQCFAEVTGDISYCEKVSDVVEQKICFRKLLNNMTVDACGEYNPEVGEILYTADCLHEIAKLGNDISICRKITKKEVKWGCLAELSKDEEICNEAETQFWKDFCLVEVLKNKLIEKIN